MWNKTYSTKYVQLNNIWQICETEYYTMKGHHRRLIWLFFVINSKMIIIYVAWFLKTVKVRWLIEKVKANRLLHLKKESRLLLWRMSPVFEQQGFWNNFHDFLSNFLYYFSSFFDRCASVLTELVLRHFLLGLNSVWKVAVNFKHSFWHSSFAYVNKLCKKVWVLFLYYKFYRYINIYNT